MTDEQLLLLLRNNPEQGVHEMMRVYGGSVATICRNFLYDFSDHDIEEVIADTFIQFWRKPFLVYPCQVGLQKSIGIHRYDNVVCSDLSVLLYPLYQISVSFLIVCYLKVFG